MDLNPLDAGAPEPPYEQLRRQIATRAASGELAAAPAPDGARAGAELGLAVNTVARTYRALEADGVVVTEGRRGTFGLAGHAAGASAGAGGRQPRTSPRPAASGWGWPRPPGWWSAPWSA